MRDAARNSSKSTPDFDPEFGGPNVGKDGFPPFRREAGGAVRWLILYPCVAMSILCVGWYAAGQVMALMNRERLDHPVAVKSLDEGGFVLADGRRVVPSFLSSVPSRDPIFLSAIRSGIEVGPRGELFGLLTVYPSCGNTLQAYSVKRVNLRDLAATLKPECVDRSRFDPDEYGLFAEDDGGQSSRVNDYLTNRMWRWRDAFEHAETRPVPTPARPVSLRFPVAPNKGLPEPVAQAGMTP